MANLSEGKAKLGYVKAKYGTGSHRLVVAKHSTVLYCEGTER